MRLRIVVATAAVLALSGCAWGERHERESFSLVQQLPVGSTLRIRDGAGNITVKPTSAPTVHVSGSRRWEHGRARDVNFVWRFVGNELYVCAMWSASGRCGTGSYRGRRTNRFMDFLALRHSTDASADFVVELPEGVRIDARTSLGTVDIAGARSGVSATSVQGTVAGRDLGGTISLSSVNGDVRLALDELTGVDSITLTTTNGAVRADLPPSFEGMLDLAAVNGSIESQFPLVLMPGVVRGGRRIRSQVGTAERTVRLRTVNGGITLNRAGVRNARLAGAAREPR
jgi:Toastrack DUF4097